MKKLLRTLRRIRLVHHHSSPFLKCVVLVTIIVSTVALISLRAALLDVKRQEQALKDQAARLEQENRTLEDDLGKVGSAEGVEKIAKEELGLVDPDSVFFVITDDAATQAATLEP